PRGRHGCIADTRGRGGDGRGLAGPGLVAARTAGPPAAFEGGRASYGPRCTGRPRRSFRLDAHPGGGRRRPRGKNLRTIVKKVLTAPPHIRIISLLSSAPVAQLDRVPGYEPGGREFESLRARHYSRPPTQCRRSFFCLFFPAFWHRLARRHG